MRVRTESPGHAPALHRLIAHAALAALLITTLSFVVPGHVLATADASTWIVDTYARTEADVRGVWGTFLPTYSGTPYDTVPSATDPYAPGATARAFRQDGLNMLNFGRYLAGLPSDDGLHAEVCDELTANAATIEEVRFLGGISAVPQTIRDAVGHAIR